MDERAELLGGTLAIESAEGKGTAVSCVFPARRRGVAKVA